MTADEPDRGQRGRDLAQAAAPAVIAGGVAELVAHVLGVDAATSALAPAFEAGIRTLREADRRCAHQIAQAIDIAYHELPDGADLEDMILADQARTELFRRVVQAAGRSTIEEKIPALGRVLARGLPDDDRVDEALLLATALSVMDAPHVQVLGFLGRRAPGDRPPMKEDLVVLFPKHSRQLLPGLLGTLVTHGLIVEGNPRKPGQMDKWTVTPLGARCVELLLGQQPSSA